MESIQLYKDNINAEAKKEKLKEKKKETVKERKSAVKGMKMIKRKKRKGMKEPTKRGRL